MPGDRQDKDELIVQRLGNLKEEVEKAVKSYKEVQRMLNSGGETVQKQPGALLPTAAQDTCNTLINTMVDSMSHLEGIAHVLVNGLE
ncbi:hypothetical protein HYALB_00011709 [Hymenoscyphus albidus]|uniref:Uncharacterized protein n=1 Tax=Hymenoscyphus albidus TaxID=595503 RepID=A0A9N9LS27_9HELO|nr:hypothetical protein HYALB_00011709 [Hymenoscyphus albidus]